MLRDQSVVYFPEQLSLLGDILDQVVESLPTAMRTPYNRVQIAKNLLACAATGERDRIELDMANIIDLKGSTAASPKNVSLSRGMVASRASPTHLNILRAINVAG